jgi:hypothetical protein
MLYISKNNSNFEKELVLTEYNPLFSIFDLILQHLDRVDHNQC